MDVRPHHKWRGRRGGRTGAHRCVMLLTGLLAALSGSPNLATGAGVVGSPDSGCTEADLDTALAGGGTVTFNCGTATTITLSSTKVITADTIIDGGGLVTLSGAAAVRVFLVALNAHLTLRGLTIAEGFGGTDPGGGIRNLGTLTVSNCIFSDSISESFGGGVDNEGTCEIRDSTFSDDQGEGGGGGIANFRTLTVNSSTFFRNSAGFADASAGSGGGIENFGDLAVSNSTFSSNTAFSINNPTFPIIGLGGGLDNEGVATFSNCTFSRNAAPQDSACGGIHNDGRLTAKNTIIANSVGADCCDDELGTTAESTHNLVDDPYSFCSGGFTQVTSDALHLHGLADNGGPTLTMALLPGSVAIGGGDTVTCMDPTTVNAVDQRGAPRFGPGDSACDIGAFEAPSPIGMPTPAVTFLALDGEPSTYFGGNLHLNLTPADGPFEATHEFGHVRIFISYQGFWQLDFAAPEGKELTPGDYVDVAAYPSSDPELPGFGITDGGGCSDITGTFSIRESEYSIDGTVDKFAADFEQHCEGVPPALFGSVRLHSNFPTASPPVVAPTFTPTPTLPVPTPTETPMAALLPCVGDCNGDGQISVDELVTGVNLALGGAPISVCPAFDVNNDGRVTIDELLRAVASALNGCSSP